MVQADGGPGQMETCSGLECMVWEKASENDEVHLFREFTDIDSIATGLGAQPGGGTTFKATLNIFDDSATDAQKIWSDHTYKTTMLSLVSKGAQSTWEEGKVADRSASFKSPHVDPFGVGVPVRRYRTQIKDYPRVLADSATPNCMINMQAFHLGLPIYMGEWGYRECTEDQLEGVPMANRTIIVDGPAMNTSTPPAWPSSATALWQGDFQPITGHLYRHQEHFTMYAQVPQHHLHGIHPGLRSFYWPYYTLHIRHVYPNRTEVTIFHDRVKQVKFQLVVTGVSCMFYSLFFCAWAYLLRQRQLTFKGTRHSITPEEIYEERTYLHSQEVYQEQWGECAAKEKAFKAKSKRVKAYNKRKRKQLADDEKKMHETAMQQMEQLGDALFDSDSFMQGVIAKASTKQLEDEAAATLKKTQSLQSGFKDPLGLNLKNAKKGGVRLTPIKRKVER